VRVGEKGGGEREREREREREDCIEEKSIIFISSLRLHLLLSREKIKELI